MSDTNEAAAPQEAAEPASTPAPEGAPEGQETPAAPAAPDVAEAAPAEPEAPTKPEPEDWRLTRIRQQSARIAALEREAAAARAAAQQQAPQGDGTGPAPAADDMERRVAEVVAQREFAAACNATYDKGKAAHPDFDEAVRAYGTMREGGPPREFLEAVTALERSADVYYALGKDPNTAIRIMGLPPVKMAVELAKMEAKLSAAPPPKPVSRAPAPVAPLGGAVSDPLPDLDDTSDGARWIAERERQENSRRKAGIVRRQ